MQFLDLTSKQFGRLTVVSRAPNKGRVYWRCKCVCGNYKEIPSNRLMAGGSTSCGCKISSQGGLFVQHKRSYVSWRNMLNRCENPFDVGYHMYGRRGITVCAQWHKLENFIADMGDRPVGASLERIDNNGPYEKKNCTWASRKAQCRNRRSNINLYFQGTSMCMTDWAVRQGMSPGLVQHRLARGWTAEEALTLPLEARVKNYREKSENAIYTSIEACQSELSAISTHRKKQMPKLKLMEDQGVVDLINKKLSQAGKIAAADAMRRHKAILKAVKKTILNIHQDKRVAKNVTTHVLDAISQHAPGASEAQAAE